MFSENSFSFFRINRVYTAAFLITLATFLVYLPSLTNGFVNWDDRKYIYENINILSFDFNLIKWCFTTFYFANWHPITWISWALDYAVWGLNPFGYHLTNIILHSINTLLVFILSIKLIQFNTYDNDRNGNMALLASSVTALLFGIHPMHVESVAWISERKDVLCSFFFFLAIILYIQYKNCKKNRVLYYFACLIVFTMALMSKPMAVSLPLVLMILDFYPLNRLNTGVILKRSLFEKLPFLILCSLSAILTILSAKSNVESKQATFQLIERLFISGRAYIFYLYKMIMPINLAPLYPYPEKVNLFTFEYAGSIILLLLITFFSFKLLKRSKVLVAAWFYFIVLLIPVIGIVQIGWQFAADRYTYLPGLGPFILSGLMVASIYKRASKYRIALITCLLLLAGSMITQTMTQIKIWKDSVTLWSHEIKIYPKNVYKAHNNRGAGYLSLRNYTDAIKDFTQAIEINPLSANAYASRGQAYNGLGKHEMAINDINKAINLNPEDPNCYNNRGDVYSNIGNFSQAINDYNKAIGIDPKNEVAYNNRGIIYSKQGNYYDAIKDFNIAIKINPMHTQIYYNRGIAYANIGNYSQAISDYNKAIGNNSLHDEAYASRGAVYSKLGNLSQAISDFNKSIEINPNDATVYFDRGNVYINSGSYSKAINDYSMAIELNPNGADIYINRGHAYINTGEHFKAISDLSKAIEINPKHVTAYLNLGIAHNKLDNHSKAIAYINKAIELNPKYALAYNNRGMIYLKTHNHKKALNDFLNAISIDSKYADAYENLGLVYKALGNRDKAIIYMEKAAELTKK